LEVDVRIVAATNLPLRQAVKRGEFREDLFYRLNVFPIHLPPLRHRRDDISQLMTHFLQQLTERHGKHATGFTNRAQRALLNYRFPGNIRELRNLIERAVILCDDELIDFAHLFSEGEDLESSLFTVSQGGKLDDQAASILAGDAFSVEHIAHEFIRGRLEGDTPPLKSFEDELFNAVASKALEQSEGNISAAARLLGIKRHQLDYRTRGN
jgi:DNA-binding NtrC family response regulator